MDPEKFNYTHAFTFPGVFSVNFTIENPVDYHNSQHDIYVQYGVKNIDVQVNREHHCIPILKVMLSSTGMYDLSISIDKLVIR
jgi:hypothetical protein